MLKGKWVLTDWVVFGAAALSPGTHHVRVVLAAGALEADVAAAAAGSPFA
jgi:hypothetical protein